MSFIVDVLSGKTYLEPSRDARTELDTLNIFNNLTRGGVEYGECIKGSS